MADQFFQSLNPAGAPDPVTPADGPGDAAGWAAVTPPGRGPADYDISAPQDIAGITGAFNAAGLLTAGAENDIYPVSPRQHEAQALLESPQGYGAMNVTTGFPDYENTDIAPGADLVTPIQGMGAYPGTYQDGIPKFGGSEGGAVPGAPAAGSMADSAGGDYPGTTQDGLTKYGTS